MRIGTASERLICQEFLSKNEYAVLATANAKNAPSAALITYLMDDQWCIYFFTRKGTQKEKNLAANNQVSLVIGTGPIAQTVQISGTAERLAETESNRWMDDFLVKREGFYAAFLKLTGYEFIGYKVTPKQIRWLNISEEADHEELVEIQP